jgi:hypothetical protein
MLVGHGSLFLVNSIFYLPKNYTLSYAEFISPIVKLLVLFIPILGLLIYVQIHKYNFLNFKYYYLFVFLNKKYFFDRVLNMFNLIFIRLSFNFFYAVIDKGIIESIIQISINLINKVANFIKKNSTYNLFFFLKIFFMFFILIIIGLILFKLYLFVINFSMLGK